MHWLVFSAYRVDQSLLAMQRHLLRSLDITPRRAQMLFVISQCGCMAARAMHQSDLARALGVRRSTVSRMVRALEAAGYVTRGRGYADLRQKRIELTSKARAILLRVEQLAFRLRLAIQVAFGAFPKDLGDLEWNLDTVKRHFDRATYRFYPRVAKMRWKFPRTYSPLPSNVS